MRRQGICVEFCIICGEQGDEFLTSPVKKKLGKNMTDALEIYDSFLTNYRKLVANGVPVKVAVPLDTSAMQLYRKRAAWHKSCKLQLTDVKVERTIQHHLEDEESYPIPVPVPVVPKEPVNKVPTISSYEPRSPNLNPQLSQTNRSLCIICQTVRPRERRLPRITTEARYDLLLNRAEEMENQHLVARLSECDWVDSYRYHNSCLMRLQRDSHGRSPPLTRLTKKFTTSALASDAATTSADSSPQLLKLPGRKGTEKVLEKAV